MQATVAQSVSGTLGRAVGLEEPLMTAGLDSLGNYQPLWQNLPFRAFPAWCRP